MDRPSIEQLWSRLWATRFAEIDVRLRFELGGDFDSATQQIARFLQAHGRASAMADALFCRNCVAVVAWNGHPPKLAGLPDDTADGFAALQSTGFSAHQTGQWRATLYPDPNDEAYVWECRSYELGHDKVARDTLLWHAIAAEMPVYPSAPVVTFLLDPSRSVLLHVYDDRGMDLISDNPAKLRGQYSEFSDWLLDYDRERMAKLF
jgi:hypothetical protein